MNETDTYESQILKHISWSKHLTMKYMSSLVLCEGVYWKLGNVEYYPQVGANKSNCDAADIISCAVLYWCFGKKPHKPSSKTLTIHLTHQIRIRSSILLQRLKKMCGRQCKIPQANVNQRKVKVSVADGACIQKRKEQRKFK